MKTLTLLSLLLSTQLYAQSGAMLSISATREEATLVLNEASAGELHRFYDSLPVKGFTLSNQRFGFSCKRQDPVVSCVFKMRAGPNSSDVETFIHKLGEQKIADLTVSSSMSKELAAAFGPVDEFLMFDNGVSLEIKIRPDNLSVIGFSQN